MIKDIAIRKLLIILLFLPGVPVEKPKFINNIINDNSILKWILLFLILVRKNDAYVFMIIFMVYQILFVIDNIYINKKLKENKKIKK